jgi:pseudouridine-5'-phosphate glycosidase
VNPDGASPSYRSAGSAADLSTALEAGRAIPGAPFSFTDEVAAAARRGAAIVALESTLLAHGLPFPTSLEVGRALEALVRGEGATPATIAVLDGRAHIGLDAPQLERVARGELDKLGRRDLGAVIAKGRSGATTVSATMALAARAGIRVFATGGIGGVHRDLEHAMDISSDLTELARTPVAVVCAGAKSILDLPRTSELLETLGVPVIGFRTDELPAFYSRESGLPVSCRVDSEAEAAEVLRAHFALGLGGALVVVPPPAEHALPAAFIASKIDEALAAAKAQGIAGKAITPFLLAHLAHATDGRSIATNRALVAQNAGVAARIAVALAR